MKGMNLAGQSIESRPEELVASRDPPPGPPIRERGGGYVKFSDNKITWGSFPKYQIAWGN